MKLLIMALTTTLLSGCISTVRITPEQMEDALRLCKDNKGLDYAEFKALINAQSLPNYYCMDGYVFKMYDDFMTIEIPNQGVMR